MFLVRSFSCRQLILKKVNLFESSTWKICLIRLEIVRLKIVLFKSLRTSKRRNKGNFTSKSNSNKIKLCGGGGTTLCVLNYISTL